MTTTLVYAAKIMILMLSHSHRDLIVIAIAVVDRNLELWLVI